MLHHMGIYDEYFISIKEGKKTIEVRLNDDKRRKIKVGDTVEFIRIPEKNETFRVQVTKLRKYDTFEAMYNDIPFKEFDCEGWTMKEMLDSTYEIYTPEQEIKWGTIAITIR
ncbi:ASCH domain-containing protein [Lysinibacillus sp. FSL K6-3209]|uniref:ASCH domain-containing protein n=2 Tax=Lysinibacillus sp. FSL K6-3209 TaxID=2921497 RepID=UPI0030D74E71